MNSLQRAFFGSVGVIAIATATSGTAFGQAAEPQSIPAGPSEPTVTPSTELGDIVVTAQRRSERLQDVPISITAISGDALGSGKTSTLADFAQKVPGLQFNAVFQSSNPTIFLRGVGVNDYNPASSGAVGVSIDDVFLNSSVGQLFNVYDVDRVEVLKGPQGTLFGRNTTGGIINIYTRRPTFDTRADASVTYGSYNQTFLDAGLGGAIVDGLLAARASVTYHRRDGWAKNVIDGSDQNGLDGLGGRLQFLLTPTDTLKINLKLEAGRSRSSAYRGKSGGTFNVSAGRPCTGDEVLALNICANPLTGFVDTGDLNNYSSNLTDNYENLDTHAAKLGIDWSVAGLIVTSITSYNWNKRILRQDQDMSPVRILESPQWSDRSRQFSQELRVSSNGTGPFKWVAGAFFMRENLKSYTDFNLLGAFSPTPSQPYFDPVNNILTIGRRYTQVTTSKALFAQADYELAEKLTFTAGFRFSWDKKKLDFITVAGPIGTPNGLLQTPLIGLLDSNPASFAIDDPIRTENDFNKPTWRFAINYKLTPGTLLYASYNRGFRSGGWNTGALASPIEFTFAEPEKIDAYEVGFKSDLLGRTLRINGAGFYYDYHNLQVFTLQPGNPVPYQRLQNADARIYGAELDVTLRPLSGLELHWGGAYLHTEYTKLNDAIYGNLKGNRLDKSPKWQISGSATYSVDLTARLKAHISGDVNYQSKMFFSPTNTSPLFRGAYTIANAEIGISDNQSGLSATIFVKNLTEKRFVQDVIDVSSFGNFGLFYNEPRTIGATISYKL